jgi:hypothetical protein
MNKLWANGLPTPNGSNPARRRVIQVANLPRAEIFALPDASLTRHLRLIPGSLNLSSSGAPDGDMDIVRGNAFKGVRPQAEKTVTDLKKIR